MAGISERVKSYSHARGDGGTQMSIFDTIQEVLNTMFDIRCSTKKSGVTSGMTLLVTATMKRLARNLSASLLAWQRPLRLNV